MEISVKMPPVSNCSVTQCAYNVSQKCHARAITVGDAQNPACDTYFTAPKHSAAIQRVAGVGACKVTSCKFNRDYECSAEGIQVGFHSNAIHCLTYTPRP